MALYEALYGRKCRTPLCWTKLDKDKMVGPDLVKQTKKKIKMIKVSLKAASVRQKSYADLKRKDIKYAVGDQVFFKVSPWKKVLRFGRMAEKIVVQPDLTYEEEPVRILAREIKELRNKQIPLVKVLWRHHSMEEATWESKETMR
ncbi:uncharacterized protein LOC131176351 [Hevea brasiliensis]|uniref:uncharacterized protein LOC131176351 n=1 Tax=Hevea brasiliensis TaxID=3981 RepID=UPI0025D8711B|nr:uncharacterized protein LOC131176351 [Hevea brasiliensis]